jgi:glyoxylase-like metal-dependent hydrolase (beta-lactamase superfamily II)
MTIDGMGTDRARCVLAPNPSPMTLDGTNTWVLREPDAERSVVIDPGPLDEEHLRRVASLAGRVALVLLTHGHPDHAEGARRFATLAGSVPVRALDPAHRLGEEGLAEGDVVEVDGLELRVMETPGHTPDSLTFWLPADEAVLTGDTVLGRGTTVVHRLGDYLASLDRLRAMAEGTRVILPGHGGKLDDPVGALDYYIGHRQERLQQVEAALAAGDRTAEEVVARVYADVDRVLWPVAEASVRAQLEYLAERGIYRP